MVVLALMAALVPQLTGSTNSSVGATALGRRVLDPGGPSCESMGIHCNAGGGLIRDSTLGLTEVVWVGPETRGIYASATQLLKFMCVHI